MEFGLQALPSGPTNIAFIEIMSTCTLSIALLKYVWLFSYLISISAFLSA